MTLAQFRRFVGEGLPTEARWERAALKALDGAGLAWGNQEWPEG